LVPKQHDLHFSCFSTAGHFILILLVLVVVCRGG
jgi:hypothetical protein